MNLFLLSVKNLRQRVSRPRADRCAQVALSSTRELRRLPAYRAATRSSNRRQLRGTQGCRKCQHEAIGAYDDVAVHHASQRVPTLLTMKVRRRDSRDSRRGAEDSLISFRGLPAVDDVCCKHHIWRAGPSLKVQIDSSHNPYARAHVTDAALGVMHPIATAESYPVCLSGGSSDQMQCDFVSLAQCRAAASGGLG